MSPEEINARYRNLLITLAREAESIREDVGNMHVALESEEQLSRRLGMRTIINAKNRQRARMLQLLGRNKAALRHFFKFADAAKVAAEKIILH